ncbi:MAG: MFS transporter [Gammaproteobacteria bacterium]|jgi:nucleoside transporter|nr:MFS transporter [Gammaproteobacteria bacterium]HJO10541.1 MFS transporter [Gammaproteobacteria bacterium]|tara:strand:+ start:1303 stop:2664 length:1362 start_codon:yes stop_codon:yes gene_type:complete
MKFIKTRLSVMMLLQYAVWGVWLPVLATYLQSSTADGGLGFTSGQVGWILGLAGSIGAVCAPFIAGQFADRYYSTEKFLALLLVLGGIVKIITAYQETFAAWLILSIIYSVLFMPTLSLTNSMAFAHLDNPDTQWPRIRVMGTIGWIAAGWLFPMIWLQSNLQFQALPPFFVGTEVADATARLADTLIVSGVLSLLYAGFCFLLPSTPPKPEAVEKLAFKKAFGLLSHRSFAILVLASIPISVIHQIYFMQTGPFFENQLGMLVTYIAPAMTVGQFAEIGFLALLGMFLMRLGFRWTIALGGLAYFARYAIWGLISLQEASGPSVDAAGQMLWTMPLIVGVFSQALHGLCYACFFASAFMYVDRIADVDIRNSAQTVFGIIILGIGPVLAGPFLGFLGNVFGEEGVVTNFAGMWFTLAAIALITTVLFGLAFRDETQGETAESESITGEVVGT